MWNCSLPANHRSFSMIGKRNWILQACTRAPLCFAAWLFGGRIKRNYARVHTDKLEKYDIIKLSSLFAAARHKSDILNYISFHLVIISCLLDLMIRRNSGRPRSKHRLALNSRLSTHQPRMNEMSNFHLYKP